MRISSTASAATIFESGTLGPTGQNLGTVDATAIRATAFNGVRFHLAPPARTTEVGGHFADTAGGTFFGATIVLEDENDSPDSGDLSTGDVIGVAQLTFPVPSAEVFGDIDVRLEPGWYALVFGSGLFGTSGSGAAIRNNLDIGDPTYTGWQRGPGWIDLADLIVAGMFVDHRFFVEGKLVSEPQTAELLCIALLYHKRCKEHPLSDKRFIRWQPIAAAVTLVMTSVQST